MRLRYAPRARADIAAIYAGITAGNPKAAGNVIRRIRAVTRQLANFSGIGRTTHIAGVRLFPTARYPYLIYYTVPRNQVEISVVGTFEN